MIDNSQLALALLIIRAACHLMICLRIVTYRPTNRDQHRVVVGFAAAMFAGLNLGEAFRILSSFSQSTAQMEPYLPGIVLCVLIWTIWAGGNLARAFPHKLLERLP